VGFVVVVVGFVVVVGIDLFDQTFDWGYTLGLGELTFPERDNKVITSYPEVLAGKASLNIAATYDIFNFNWNPAGGQIGAVGYNIAIPENEELQKWFSDMDVDAGVSAAITIEFPFNMKSYYNARKATSGSTFDYNLLVDSIGADSPAITYNVGAFIDLSSVSIMGYNLDRYDLSFTGDIFSADGFNTPFGDSNYEYEITDLVMLDDASRMLNDYISDLATALTRTFNSVLGQCLHSMAG